jgi:hypothetical protein
MTSTTRQLQGCTADRQDAPFEALYGAGPFGDSPDFGQAANDAPPVRRATVAPGEVLAPGANLSIASWYAISGTAMA